jgi:hypothetical protein
MGVSRLFRFKLLAVMIVLVVLSAGQAAWGVVCTQVGDGVCCADVWANGGNCCWAIGCSDGSGDGGCSPCQYAKVNNGAHPKDPGLLMARVLARDAELSRALSSIR